MFGVHFITQHTSAMCQAFAPRIGVYCRVLSPLSVVKITPKLSREEGTHDRHNKQSTGARHGCGAPASGAAKAGASMYRIGPAAPQGGTRRAGGGGSATYVSQRRPGGQS